MFSTLTKSLLTISALTPVTLIYGYVAATEKHPYVASALILGSVVLVLLCYYVLQHATKSLERFELKITSVEPADQENISFLLLYISPLFVDSLSAVNFNIVVPTIFVYALLLSCGYSYHFNPVLSLMRWHFYKVQTTEGVSYVLLTTRQIKNVDNVKSVGQLTGYTLIELAE